MRSNYPTAITKTLLVGMILLLSRVSCSAQAVTVGLTATQQTAFMPDGNTVPMWGWQCDSVSALAKTCLALTGTPQAGGAIWQPPLIVVPTGVGLTINLTNNLPMETSVTIVGQLGGGLGSPQRESGPRTDGAHAGQTQTTWPIQTGATFTPPSQGLRARSFVPEAGPNTGTQHYQWAGYNLQTGQGLKPGTYLIETGTYPSIQGPMGLYGVLVVTTPPAIPGTTFNTTGIAYAGSVITKAPNTSKSYQIQYDADVPLLLSEIDPVQNSAVAAAAHNSASETAKWTPACGQANACYPPAVNYTPLYYLVNGQSFDKTSGASATAAVGINALTGNVLLRFVNAGLRMHVPSAAGLNMSLVAEDGNVLPDIALQAANGGPTSFKYNARTQNEVFLAAGKAYDVIVNPANNATPSTPPTAYNAGTFTVFDRQGSLSGNAFQHDTGMQAIIQVGGGTITPLAIARAVDDKFIVPAGASTFTANVLSNDTGISNASQTQTVACATSSAAQNFTTTNGGNTVTLNPNGSFVWTQTGTGVLPDSFTYCGNGNPNLAATVTLTAAKVGGAPTATDASFTSKVSSLIKVNAPGVLAYVTDPTGYPLTASTSVTNVSAGMNVIMNPDGGFTATLSGNTNQTQASFTYQAVNSQGTSSNPATVTLNFLAGSGLQVHVQDAQTKASITDYKWIIEQDLTMHINPAAQVNNGTLVPNQGTNFHTSYMPVIASGCTGPQSCERSQTVYDPVTHSHVPAACDGSGICYPDPQGAGLPQSMPGQVNLTATNPDGSPVYYYVSILPGDAANPFDKGYTGSPANCTLPPTDPNFVDPSKCGHTMGGAPVAPGQTAVTVNVEPNPLPTATVTVFVFEDDFPLNGEPDAGGGVDSLSTQEGGLGDFQVELWDDAGSSGDATGQMTYDMFNEPLTNSLNGTLDPATGLNACPIASTAADSTGKSNAVAIGTIIVCPLFESDGKTPSPLTGQAVIKNLMPGRYGIIVHPGAARAARGEEWLQTNTLDGTHFLDSFVRAGEPAYFQEFGPGGFHVFMGMANPAIINKRLATLCGSANAPACNNTIQGQVSNLHMSRPPSEQLFSSGSYAALSYTACYVSIGEPDGATVALTKCDPNGNFTFTGLPDGDYALVVFDQWLELIVDGSSKAVSVKGGTITNVSYSAFSWQTHIFNNIYMDVNGNGIQDPGEPPIAQVASRIRMRNGKFNNFSLTDITGHANFYETFPLFSWYVVESDTTRYKGTGVHVVYDAGGQVDGPAPVGNGNTVAAYQGFLNSIESFPVANNLRVPGAVYCGKADCSDVNLATNPQGGGPGGSTGRIDPGTTLTEGLQGFLSQTQILDWGKQPYGVGENGGIRGHVVYSSTRPFDDPNQLFQNLWEPLVPRVTVNLYQEGTAPDGTQTLTLIDTTTTSSWDDWSSGFHADGVTPNMSCPGQDPADPFFNYTLKNSPNPLNPNTSRPDNAQFKCYDGLHVFNQVQPAPYDGMYQFPTVNCKACVTNPVNPGGPKILPTGKYVTEVVVPPGYELVKEEDKNILIGDNYIAPVTQQFGAISNIFIVPDQATINNGNPAFGTGGGATNPTTDLGRSNIGGFGPGGLIVMPAACVGALRVVPDFMSISPESGEVAPFAGASRHLCDRKELTLDDQMQAQADFFIFTKTPAASHFSGFILDDFSSEFDPASPTFGEKFAVPNLPISIRDFNGVEVSRVYSDQWGIYNGLTYSTWDVDPPNPTGYAPNMMITCMNDPGPIPDPNHPGQLINDPLYNPAYSNFCYENPFMPADTDYLDTPVVPVSAFAESYNPPDCAYPDRTPAIASVAGDSIGGGAGPWVSAFGNQITIHALGDQSVPNNAYSGPAASSSPFNQKFITRHYGFGQNPGTVTIGGVPLTNVQWDDMTITGNVPSGVPACALQQAGQPTAYCGELVITAANGQQSIDTVTVTIGGKTPTYVQNGSSTIQSAIDKATPGDLIIVGPGTYNEMLLMWQPVRLQGVGAASVTVNANAHPAGKIDPWRRQVDCLFGLALNGGAVNNTINPATGKPTNPYDPTGAYSCSSPMQGAVDPLPLETTVGWNTSFNGNLSELLQEPTLMGAYEGAAITVLAKGMENAADVATGAAAVIPLNNTTDCSNVANFLCAPSRIDGMSFTNSSQGGGGIWLHGWSHNLEISNNRVHSNGGTLTGGITVGQAETTDGTLIGTVQAPFLYNTNVNIHHNAVTANASYGDELNSNTPSSSGGVTICSGSDYYKFDYNWVCGNLSTGDGGGFAHFGFSYNGDISHNSFLFNQSFNPTLTTHGGGVIVQGAPPDGTACENSSVDLDCPPQLSDGVGPGLTINANLIQGNTAESGDGGGLRLQNVNGTDVQRNPSDPSGWYKVSVTNNIIVNNVAGWAGGGVSLQDAVLADFINNTIASNDTTASAGVLFDSALTPNSNVPPPGCDPVTGAGCNNPITTSQYEPAGLQTSPHGIVLSQAFTAPGVSCPAGHPNCTKFSNPVLANNLFWQNRAFYITTGANPIPGLQTVVTLVPQLSQTATGACPTTGFNGGQGPYYWDVGVYGDTAPGPNTTSGLVLNPVFSILDDPGYDPSNRTVNPKVVSQYCNGSRVPPEIAPQICTNGANAPGCGNGGITVPPGVPDLNPFYPLFTLNPAATPDEGNNWINMFYGPLALSNASLAPGQNGYGVALGNYAPASGSPAIDAIGTNSPTYALAPSTDFYGNPRPDASGSQVDIGAVEVQGSLNPTAAVAPTSVTYGNQLILTPSTQLVTLSNTGDGPLSITSMSITGANANDFTVSNNPCGTSLAGRANCGISVNFTPTMLGARSASLNIASNDRDNPSLTVGLTGTGTAPIAGVIPTTYAFGNQLINTSTVAQVVTLSNTGNAPLTIASISVSDPTNYGLNNGCGGSLATGTSCPISITFNPTTPGAKNATLTVTDNSNGVNGSTQSAGLTGAGVAPVAKVSPTSLTFPAGTSPKNSQVVTLSNTGNAPLTINSINYTGADPADFLQTNNCGTSLAAGASCTVNVSFKPTVALTRSATLNINDNSFGTPNPQTVSVSGTSVGPILNVQPAALTFTSLANVTSQSQTITVSNGGTANLRIISIGLNGANANEFGAIPNCPIGGTSALVPNASCTITVTFKPSSTNSSTRMAKLTVNAASPAVAQSVSLTGNVRIPNVSGVVAPSSGSTLAFGNQQVGTTSAAQTVTITNSTSSTANLVIASINFSRIQYHQSGCTIGGSGLAPGASCTMNVTFDPAGAGLDNGTMIVHFGSPASPASATYALSGTGVRPSGKLSPAPAFGTVKSGTTSAPETVTFTNTGLGPVKLNSITTVGQFAVATGGSAGTCDTSTSIPAGGTCTINVTFTPTGLVPPAQRSGSLKVIFGGTSNITVVDSLIGSTH
jgi:hypothetical protein